MKPDFTLDPDELIADFVQNGAYSFDVKKDNVQKLRSALYRAEKSRTMMLSSKTFFDALMVLFYNTYDSLMLDFGLRRKDEEAFRCVLCFKAVYSHMLKVENSEVDSEHSRVTIVART